MSDTKHTPGPWIPIRSCQDYDGSFYYEPEDEQKRREMLAKPFTGIAAPKSGESIFNAHDLFEFRNVANAHLIAAAPDLYAAAEAAVRYDEAIESCANDPEMMASFCTAQGDTLDALYFEWRDKSRAALAKAKGEPQ